MTPDKLSDLRKLIDEIDTDILLLLEKRMKITDEVGAYKRANNISILQKGREEALKEHLMSKTDHQILKNKIGEIYEKIIETSKTSMHVNNLPQSPFNRIAIIGLGIIGGSLAKILKLKNLDIIISTLKRDSIDNVNAAKDNFIDKEYDSLEQIVSNNDLIILASPIGTIPDLARALAHFSSKQKHPVIIIDVASVKSDIYVLFEQLTTDNLLFIPTHPMAGSEKKGFAESDVTLFVQRPWVICPHSKVMGSSLEKIRSFIQSVGSDSIVMDYKQHDINAAIVSHLIFVISTYLLAFAQAHPESLQIAGTGFESTTRLASGNIQMHKEIVQHNYLNIIQQLHTFIEFIKANPLTKETAQEFFDKNKQSRDHLLANKNKV